MLCHFWHRKNGQMWNGATSSNDEAACVSVVVVERIGGYASDTSRTPPTMVMRADQPSQCKANPMQFSDSPVPSSA